jgi:hypothetical protein
MWGRQCRYHFWYVRNEKKNLDVGRTRIMEEATGV